MQPDPLQDKLILVVEDNEVIREGLAVVLRRCGCGVALAADSGMIAVMMNGRVDNSLARRARIAVPSSSRGGPEALISLAT